MDIFIPYKFNKFDEMEDLFERYKLPKLTKEKIDYLNISERNCISS